MFDSMWSCRKHNACGNTEMGCPQCNAEADMGKGCKCQCKDCCAQLSGHCQPQPTAGEDLKAGNAIILKDGKYYKAHPTNHYVHTHLEGEGCKCFEQKATMTGTKPTTDEWQHEQKCIDENYSRCIEGKLPTCICDEWAEFDEKFTHKDAWGGEELHFLNEGNPKAIKEWIATHFISRSTLEKYVGELADKATSQHYLSALQDLLNSLIKL